MEVGLNRRNVARLILLAWAVALAWLARRQFYPSDQGANSRLTRVSPGAWFYAVYAGARQVGQLNITVDTLVDGVRLGDVLVLDLPSGDTTRQLAQGAQYTLSRGLRLRAFSRTVFGVGPPERLEAVLAGDSIIGLSTSETPKGLTARTRFRVSPEVVTPSMLPYRAAFRGQLRTGQEFTMPMLDLGAGGSRPLTVRVTAESTFVVPDSAKWDPTEGKWVSAHDDTLRAWRLEHDAPGVPTVTWVDAGGAIVHARIGNGLTLVRSAWEIVFTNYRMTRRIERPDWRRAIPGMVALAALNRAPDTTAATVKFLMRADSGAPMAAVPRALVGGRQSLHGDTLLVERWAPFDSGARKPLRDLGPWVDLPVANLRIRAAARGALAETGARTAEDSARQLTRWVARAIATDLGDEATAAAVVALLTRSGGPDAKARLLATMAREVGFPARVVSGLAVLPGGSFGHSWTEIWLGRWVAADPTFGHFPASTSLIRLWVAGRSRPLDLIPLGGSAQFLPIKRR